MSSKAIQQYMLSVDSAYRPMRWTFEVSFRSRALYTFLHISRVLLPTIIRQSTEGRAVLKRKGLMSFNFLWLLWAVCGGIFITNIINSNWLASTVKPKFAEKPVDTAQVRWDENLCTIAQALIYSGVGCVWERADPLHEAWLRHVEVHDVGDAHSLPGHFSTNGFCLGLGGVWWNEVSGYSEKGEWCWCQFLNYLTQMFRARTPCCWAHCRSRITRLLRRWARPGTAPGRSSPRTCPTLATSPTRSGRLLRNAANPSQLYLWPLKTLKYES